MASASGNVITISEGAGTSTLSLLDNDAIVKADSLVHLAAPSIQVSGIVQAGITSAVVNDKDANDVDADRSIDFSATSAVADVVYRVSIGDIGFAYTALANDTMATIAGHLAAQIDAHANFAANASGDIISITAGAGTKNINVGEDGRVLMNAGGTLKISDGYVSSNGRITSTPA